MIYHSSTTDEVLSYFEVDSEKGLPTGVADQRLIKYGKNIMSKAKKTSLLSVIKAQFKSHINIIILISGLLSLTVNLLYNRHHWYSPILIFFMLALNILITVFSEMRTEKITNSIKTMNIPHVKVLRDGKIKTVRMLAVDTPESVHPSKGVEFYGKEASNFTSLSSTPRRSTITFDTRSNTVAKIVTSPQIVYVCYITSPPSI